MEARAAIRHLGEAGQEMAGRGRQRRQPERQKRGPVWSVTPPAEPREGGDPTRRCAPSFAARNLGAK